MKVEEPAFKYYQRYSVTQWEQWQDQWELIDGFPYCMSPLPIIEHQRVSNKIIAELERNLKMCTKCMAIPPINWKINLNTVVQPDVSLVCPPAKGLYLTRAPEIIFEILSPSTALKDRNQKMELYAQQKVKYYIIVDLKKEIAEVYLLKKGVYEKVLETRSDKYIFDSNCKINFSFSKIWL